MDSSSKRTTSFEYTVRVEASEVEVEFLEAMSYVDLERLGEAEQTRIEIGTVTTDCGRRLVRGVIEKGMLTAIEVEPDEDETDPGRADIDPGILGLLEAASSALGIKPPSGRLPIPMADLVANPRIAVETWTCVRVHTLGITIFCCWGRDSHGSYRVCWPITGRFPRLPIPSDRDSP